MKLGQGLWLSTQRVADDRPPEWPGGGVPQQVSLDLAVDDLDTAEDAAPAVEARRAATQPSPERWRVLLDPAGHPFSLTTLLSRVVSAPHP